MMTAIQWLEAHSPAVTALATIVLTVTTLAYAWQTKVLARETRVLRRAGTEPEVVAYLLPHPVHLVVVNLIVANVGKGPAFNVELEFEAEASDFTAHNVRFSAGVRRQIMAVLPQDERYVQVFGFGQDLHKNGPLKDFTLHVHFSNSKGERRRNTTQLSIADFEGFGRLGGDEPPDFQIASALNKISGQVKGWSSPSGRLKVETITRDEQVESDQQLREQIRARQAQLSQIKSPKNNG